MYFRLNKSYVVVLFLLLGSLLGIIYSSILVYHHVNHDFQVAFCGSDLKSGCNALNRSTISEIKEIPVSVIGVFYYAFSFLLAITIYLYSNKRIRLLLYLLSFILSLVAVFVDIFFVGYSVIQQTICKLCLLTYISTFFIFLGSIWGLRKYYQTSLKNLFQDAIEEYYHLVFHLFLSFLIAVFIALSVWSFSNKSFYKDPFKTFSVALKQYKQHIFSNASIKSLKIDTIYLEAYVDLKDEVTQEIYEYLVFYKSILKEKLDIEWRFYPLDSVCNKAYSVSLSEKSCFLSRVAYCTKDFQVQDRLLDFLYKKGYVFSKIQEQLFLNLFSKYAQISQTSLSTCVYSKRIRRHTLKVIQTFEQEVLSYDKDIDIYVPMFQIFDEFYNILPPISFLRELLLH